MAITLMVYVVAPMMIGQPIDRAAMLGARLGGSWIAGMLTGHLLYGALLGALARAPEGIES